MWRVDESIGARIAAYRKRKGMTQALLAGLVGRSESWLSQVERGARDVDRLSVLLRLAELLDVTVEMLTGKAAPARDSATAPALLDGVRAALTRYDRLATAPTRLPPFPQLRALVVETHRAYQSARYAQTARMGDPLRVLSAAATVNTNALPVALNGRRASLHLDLATAQAQRRHDPEAVFHLIEAERIAPELLRYYVTAHVIIRDLLRRERRAQTPALRPLAARAGVL
jgi:transcriptional regulator with XRE-family HTH domain